ncbi:AAA family ATPase [Paenibacillus dendritiformis]|uniref:AAA family ATPase n=1 Tax=Paenibacillus dendritiformis TaxID=130049 RepID=UPI0023B0A4D8|nr:AAA family ATPase [Paenibacillus dendritiformis]
MGGVDITKCTLFRDDFVIITGGPGAGKTMLLKEMTGHGFPYVPEVAREIIQAEMCSHGDALPWRNAIKYRDIMLEKSIVIGNRRKKAISREDFSIMAFCQCWGRWLNHVTGKEITETAHTDCQAEYPYADKL